MKGEYVMQTLTKEELMMVNGGGLTNEQIKKLIAFALSFGGTIIPGGLGFGVSIVSLLTTVPPINGGSDEYSLEDVKFIGGNRPVT